MNNVQVTERLGYLKAARDLLVQVGWTQGKYMHTDEHTRKPLAYCAVGALNEVTNQKLSHFNSYKIEVNRVVRLDLWEVLPKSAQVSKSDQPIWVKSVDDLVRYNDRKGRQKRTILAWFDRAIDRLENL